MNFLFKMNRFNIRKLSLSGLIEIIQLPIIDNRGFFSRIYCQDIFKELSFCKSISQINHTFTAKSGTIRGMHYQLPPATETKMITCLKGKIYDVVIDIRKNSSTFLESFSIELSSELNNSLIIPKGFAHGFQTLVNDVELLYLHDTAYNKVLESGLNPNDTNLKIKWPMKASLISERDLNHPFVESINFKGI